ncbi:MAG: rhomboid family intramembrane serine protease [Spirochaetales bacterium]|nr:rhomboid family intramembrane serine protease [Spirochaetales bacterium]
MRILEALRKPIRYSFFYATFWLIGINIFLYFLTFINISLYRLLALYSSDVFLKGYFWQPFTYMFIHSKLSITHILFNMFGLFVFGFPLEKRLGSVEFLLLYLFTGTATGIIMLLFGLNVVGASGAIFGLVLGYATFYPDSTLLLGFFIPIKARIAVILFVVLSVILHFIDRSSNIGHLGHLAGLFFSSVYFIVRLGINPVRVLFRK